MSIRQNTSSSSQLIHTINDKQTNKQKKEKKHFMKRMKKDFARSFFFFNVLFFVQEKAILYIVMILIKLEYDKATLDCVLLIDIDFK